MMKSKAVPPEAVIIGKNLKNLREKRGLKQKELASCMDVTFQQVQKYESGRNRIPIEKLYTARQKLEVPYESFFVGMPKNIKEESSYLKEDIQEEIEQMKDKESLLTLIQLFKVVRKREALARRT